MSERARHSQTASPETPLPASLERLVTPRDWQHLLTASAATVERMRRAKLLPEPDAQVLTMPRWRASTVKRFLEGDSR